MIHQCLSERGVNGPRNDRPECLEPWKAGSWPTGRPRSSTEGRGAGAVREVQAACPRLFGLPCDRKPARRRRGPRALPRGGAELWSSIGRRHSLWLWRATPRALLATDGTWRRTTAEADIGGSPGRHCTRRDARRRAIARPLF